jgi:hypothetical protein
VQPTFEEGSSLGLQFDASDDSSLKNVEVYFRIDGGSWELVKDIVLTPSLESRHVKETKASARIPARGNAIDVKILLEDASGNSQDYTVEPVSLKKRDLSFEIFSEPPNYFAWDKGEILWQSKRNFWRGSRKLVFTCVLQWKFSCKDLYF